MEYYGVIYSATNKVNNKKYIGQTTCSLEKRKREHINAINQQKYSFQKAMKKYDTKNFIWEIIDHADSPEELDFKETFWIDYYNTYGKDGYNMTIGGQKYIRPSKEKRIEYLKTFEDNHPFLVFDKHGNFIEESDNRMVFCLENDIPVNDSLVSLTNKNLR